jgi:cyclopropane fatty-acyl-phospholipid synthase-like methyltransferase
LSHSNIERAKDFFEPRPALYGDSHLAVDWGSRKSQIARFDAFGRLAPLHHLSLLDVGCGLGHLIDWLSEKQISLEFYEGIDIASSMVTAARERHPHILFHECDLFAGEQPTRERYDVVFASGIFYLALDEPYAYIKNVLDMLYMLTGQVLVFNILTETHQATAGCEFRADTDKILEIITDLSPHFCVDQSYHASDVSIAIYRTLKNERASKAVHD